MRVFKDKSSLQSSRLFMLIRNYVVLVLVFMAEKPLFMLYADGLQRHYSIRDWIMVVWHGLPIDLSVAGYLLLLPLVIVIIGIWLDSFPVKRVIQVYDAISALVLSSVFIADTVLYPFWGFKLDASVLFYLKTPKEAMASVSPWMVVLGIAVILLWALCIYLLLIRSLKPVSVPFNKVLMRVPITLFNLILFVPLFLAIRGGMSESTMNVGRAYFSSDQFLNHSAVNPGFSLLSSVSKTTRFDEMYNYLDEKRRAELFEGLYKTTDDDTEILLNTDRPNILVVVLESFGGDFVHAISGREDVSPRLDSLIGEGVFFSNCYAGSFRTDRGLICIMNGHPGLPKTSIMKLPTKSAALPSLPASLSEAGYETYFMYGGDINFTNMKSWLFGTGFRNIVADTDFTLAQRHSNAWGVNDDITFDRLLKDLKERTDSLWFTGFLSLSSHEPFDVPYHRLPDKVDNAFAYTDSCLGDFVDSLKQTPVWDNLLMVILPDHGFRYTRNGLSSDPHVHHIPILWIGGAVREPKVIDRLIGQTDMAATILGQLGIGHSEYLFSRNVLSGSYSYPFSFYTYNNGLCFIDSTGVTLYDDDASECLINDSDGSEIRLDRGKAILQTLYDDLEER